MKLHFKRPAYSLARLLLICVFAVCCPLFAATAQEPQDTPEEPPAQEGQAQDSDAQEAAQEEATPEPEGAAEEDTPPVLSSPRATVQTFIDAMNRVRQGDTEALNDALACLYLGDLPEEERQPKGVQLADQLYDVLDRLTFSLENIPEAVDGANFAGAIGQETEIQIVLHKNEDDQWRFSYSQMLSNLGDLEQQVVAENETGKEEQAAVAENFVPELGSPRATMSLFLSAMNERGDLRQEDAVKTLDLSELPERMRASLGGIRAFQLKEVLDRYKEIFLPEIPNESIRPPYPVLRDEAGNIILESVTEEDSGLKAWRFSAATVESLPALYEKFRTRDRVVEGGETIAKPFSLRIRDYFNDTFGDHAPVLRNELFGLEIWQWLGLLLIILVGMTISRVIAWLIGHTIRRFFARENLTLDAELERGFVRPIRIAFMAWVWFLGLHTLTLPPNVYDILRSAAIVVTALGGVWAAYRLVDIIGGYLHERAETTHNKFDDLLAPLVARSLKVLVIAIGLIVVVDTLGWDPTRIMAGLGLGGLAFALAARDTVANVFGSVTVLTDRPFQIGDWVVINGTEGTIEQVGMRSTRIRTFYNSLVTMPNSEISTATIDNYGMRRYRRVKATLGVQYDTTPEKIEAFCEGIRQLIREHPYTRKDYYHVYFTGFAASALEVLVYCFLDTPDWGTEMRERQRLFLDIMRLAKRLDIAFAFPTQTLHFAQPDGKPPDHTVPTEPLEAQATGRSIASKLVSQHKDWDGGKPPAVTFPPVDYAAPGASEKDKE